MELKWVVAGVLCLAFCGWFFFKRKKMAHHLGGSRSGPPLSGLPMMINKPLSCDSSENLPYQPLSQGAVELAPPPIQPEYLAQLSSTSAPERRKVASLHCEMRTQDRVFERSPAEAVVTLLNQFHDIGFKCSAVLGGRYERSSGSSFFIHWPSLKEGDCSAAVLAVRSGLALRREFGLWNESRRSEGYLPLSFAMGVDWGFALLGVVGAQARRENLVVGEPVSRSRALGQVAVLLGSDCLVSEQVWQDVSNRFSGERAVENTELESQLVKTWGIGGLYFIKASLTEIASVPATKQPMPETVPLLSDEEMLVQVEKPGGLADWFVNNGSRIIGPMSASEVARALYAQELDFDCECWQQQKGERQSIGHSELFSYPAPKDLSQGDLWVFDGQTIQGPWTEESFKNENARKKFPAGAFFCQKSTLIGWKPVPGVTPAVMPAIVKVVRTERPECSAQLEVAPEIKPDTLREVEMVLPVLEPAKIA